MGLNLREFYFAVALFLSSAGGLIIEIVAGRLIAPYVGMSLYTWTAIIAVVLAGLSVGHWIGGRMASEGVSDRALAQRLAVALGLASVSSLASLVLVRVVSGLLLTSGLGPVLIVVLLSTILFLLPSLFVGIVAPVLTKIAIDERPDSVGPVLGRMFAIGTVGSIAGTLGAGYLFVSWIGSIGTVIAVAAVYAVLAVIFAVMSGRGATLATGAILLVGTAGTLIPGQRVEAFTTPCTVESDYFCIRIDDFQPFSGRPSALMALDHLVHSINDRDEPRLLFSPYIHFVDEYVRRHREHLEDLPVDGDFSAFFIGGGGYTLPRAWSEAYDSPRLVVAEVDPAVTAAARDHLWLDDTDPAMEIHHRDARALLQAMPVADRFDVIFGDAFHDISIPAHLVTREFHGKIARRLNPGGIYTVNVVDNGSEPRFLAALVRTLQADFSAVEVWAGAEELQAAWSNQGLRVTFNVIAGNGAAGDGPSPRKTLISRFGPDRLWWRWEIAEIQARAGEVPILTDNFAPVDRLMSTLLNTPES
ncbi:MAG: fused MFS/spermidine synthase [Alphaproteobacteria bacterium]|nr:fused MFS/spermidine synthase [Alphaproteobacteria bacterium]